MGPTAVRLRIVRFHNCEGCLRKVGIALHHIHGVELVELDPESGNVTVSTDKHPEVIKVAIERKTKKNFVSISEEVLNPRNQNPIFSLPPQYTINVQDLDETLLRVSQAEGLNNVELVGDLNSNSFRLDFNQRLPDFSSRLVMFILGMLTLIFFLHNCKPLESHQYHRSSSRGQLIKYRCMGIHWSSMVCVQLVAMIIQVSVAP